LDPALGERKQKFGHVNKGADAAQNWEAHRLMAEIHGAPEQR